jgi:predicted RecB family nuclease
MQMFRGAICATDAKSHYWVSYEESEVEYAKMRCRSCSASEQCLAYLFSSWDDLVGVLAGISEYDRLEMKWEEGYGVKE